MAGLLNGAPLLASPSTSPRAAVPAAAATTQQPAQQQQQQQQQQTQQPAQQQAAATTPAVVAQAPASSPAVAQPAAATSARVTNAAAVTTAQAAPTMAPAAASTASTVALASSSIVQALAVTSSAPSAASGMRTVASSTTSYSVTATGTSINTFGTVTTTGIQGVPTSVGNTADSTSGGKNASFPVAAQAIVGVVGALIALFLAYRGYLWWYRRSHRAAQSNPFPETRPLAGERGASGGQSPSMDVSMSMANVRDRDDGAWGDTGNYSTRKTSMQIESSGTWGRSSPSSFQYGSPFNNPAQPSSRSASPSGGGSNGSRASLPAAPSRNSFSSTHQLQGTARRSVYGGAGLYSGPQLRPTSSSNRLTGAPHSQAHRIDIIPPLPLGAPPTSVVATDKSTLDFAPSSGIGSNKDGESWFTDSVTGERRRSTHLEQAAIRHSQQYAPSPRASGSDRPATPSSPASSSDFGTPTTLHPSYPSSNSYGHSAQLGSPQGGHMSYLTGGQKLRNAQPHYSPPLTSVGFERMQSEGPHDEERLG